MAKPAGVIAKTKDNSKKKFREHEEWSKGKKIGRPRQVWVWDITKFAEGGDVKGHWEKVSA